MPGGKYNPRVDSRVFYSQSESPERALLSNFHELSSSLLIDGHRYPTVEHYYQAAKCAMVGDIFGALSFTMEAPDLETAVGHRAADAKCVLAGT